MEINSFDQTISFSTLLVGWLLTWSWQILLLFGVAWIALRFDRSRSATIRYRIWLIAIVAVSALPLLSLLIYSLKLPAAISPSLFPYIDTLDNVPIVPTEQPEQPAISWLAIGAVLLFTVWAVGVIISLARLGNSLWKLHKIQSSAQPVSMADLECSDTDLLLRSASVALSKDVQSPGLAGFINPVILLPTDIVSWTSPEERVSILRHEFAHLDRYDHLVSLFQSILKSLLFFHPLLRYGCSQLNLERELACDDRVLGLGTEPRAYAESILKAAERSFLTDVVHQTASFASKRKLERRIEMILDTRRRQPFKQWHFLLPALLISLMTWLVIPAASSQSALYSEASQPEMSEVLSQSQSIDKAAIWVDTVKKGTMLLLVRGLGVLRTTSDGKMKAQIDIPESQAKDIKVGQHTSIDTRKGVVSGEVLEINPRVRNGMVTVEISITGELPKEVSSGLRIDGLIEVGHLNDVVYVGRPAQGQAGSAGSLFKIASDGKTATRVQVRYGTSSVASIEVVEGLEVGDKVIISDMSQFEGVETIRLN